MDKLLEFILAGEAVEFFPDDDITGTPRYTIHREEKKQQRNGQEKERCAALTTDGKARCRKRGNITAVLFTPELNGGNADRDKPRYYYNHYHLCNVHRGLVGEDHFPGRLRISPEASTVGRPEIAYLDLLRPGEGTCFTDLPNEIMAHILDITVDLLMRESRYVNMALGIARVRLVCRFFSLHVNTVRSVKSVLAYVRPKLSKTFPSSLEKPILVLNAIPYFIPPKRRKKVMKFFLRDMTPAQRNERITAEEIYKLYLSLGVPDKARIGPCTSRLPS